MDPNLAQIATARAELNRLGIPADALSDEDAVSAWSQIVRATIPSPPVRAGSSPVNAIAWATAALTAGGFAQPEDRRQQADLGDGGSPVDLGVLAILVMRHLSEARPQGWTDRDLAQKVPQGNPEDFDRAQAIIDQASADAGVEAKQGQRWWLEV